MNKNHFSKYISKSATNKYNTEHRLIISLCTKNHINTTAERTSVTDFMFQKLLLEISYYYEEFF